jgi:glycosyltransferase involved in cell wall biosynthesis
MVRKKKQIEHQEIRDIKGNRLIAVVIPAYNEQKLIRQAIDNVPDYVDKIVVVDDFSSDDTAEKVRERQKTNPDRIVLIQHTENQGVGGAIASGYIWCRDHDVEAAAVMAGDAQMDPDDLPRLLKPVLDGDVDYAKGNRLFTGDAWHIIPRIRYIGNSGMSLLTKIASGYWHVADSQCGYTVINEKALKTIDWEKMYKRYGMPNDLLVRLNIYDFRVRDYPVKPVYNIGEKSGIKPLRMAPRLFVLLIRLFMYRMVQKYVIRDFHPLVFFYFLAFFLILISTVLFIRVVVQWFMAGHAPPISTMTLMFTAIFAAQSLFFSMWFDMQDNRNLK